MQSSFSIVRRGARERVKAALKSETANPPASPQHQIEALKDYLATQIDGLPAEFNAVSIAANGELQDGRSVLHNCTVQGEKLDL